MLTLEKILAVENDPVFLDFKCIESGYLLWPLIRQEFIQFIISDLVYKSAPLISLNRNINYRKALISVIKAQYHNARVSNNKNDLLLMASGAGLFLRNGQWFNRLSDYFAMANSQETLVMEDLFDWNWPEPRENKRVVYSTPHQIYFALMGRLSIRQSHVRQARDIVTHFKNRAIEILNWNLSPSDTSHFESRMARKIAEVPLRKHLYESFLKQTSSKLVIKEEGCYGHSSIFNRVAREMGVVVAEYQHGTVNAGHDAYNVAPELRADTEYKNTFPQCFLSYGQWWHQYIHLPIDKIPIGNPHRTSQLSRLNLRSNKTDILVLGDGVETQMYLNLAIFLSENLNEWRVVFRPHPLEREKLKNLISMNKLGRVLVDVDLDIYSAFCNAHVVVNEVSTGLFEAVGLADRVLIWDTPKSKFYYPNHPFTSFVDKHDLLQKIKDGSSGRLDIESANSLWADDWLGNYNYFLKQHCNKDNLESIK